jgi:hypothetical protein
MSEVLFSSIPGCLWISGCYKKFEEIAQNIKVKIVHRLGLDYKTRWNSTYKMLTIALPYKPVFTHAKRVDKFFDYAPK